MERTDVVVRFIGKEQLDFEELEKIFPFNFDKHKKGSCLYKRYIVENDIAVLQVQNENDEIEDKIRTILNMLKPYKEHLRKLSNECNIIMRIYLESAMAQMYLYLPSELIMEMSRLSLNLEFSVFSEGMVQCHPKCKKKER